MTKKCINRFCVLFVAVAVLQMGLSANAIATEKLNDTWQFKSENNEPGVKLYFYWSKKCPHCREALPFVTRLDKELPWLKLYSRELTEYPEHVEQYIAMAAALGKEARSVPAFFWCGNMLVGYDNPANMGQYLKNELQRCHEWLKQGQPGARPEIKSVTDDPVLFVPLLGQISLKDYSLPVYTLILAGVDAFNPCAFFVLLFLLSLLVHTRSRQRMLIVGSVFVLCSGVMYFLFMTAWLNLFLAIGQLNAITIAAGIVAVTLALVNIKDYFWFKQGVSLSIAESAKPGLYQRTRQLVNTDNLPAVIIATLGLATFANLYELLCTAGFPMVYTRILTMESLPATTYYLYLVFYNLIYVLPLLVIVLVFSFTFGAKKLQVEQGRQLKLLSGIMMLLLGAVLLVAPGWLSNVLVAVGLVVSALLVSAIVIYWHSAKQASVSK